ncbi:hypothetical protein VitviT2T_028754 [Vitis vinifera]|uniref:Retrotransposon gag domain-containing protein n=1 Tax=Vitis vinifera TaxID=29760 RepID=A0ABY9DU99_VITVI|nr:hypothetical protein VitviT2T_028754 [Vitis vinifera]
MEERLAKVGVAMVYTREGVDLIDQSIENGLEDIREQIQDLHEGVLISQVQLVSHEEFMSFQYKRFANIENETCTINTWDTFKREIKRQFYPEDVAYLEKKNMKRLMHIDSIHEYIKEFSALMFEILNMSKEELLFNFMDNIQSWVKQELRRHGVQDLATAMKIVEFLVEYKREDSSKPKP